MNVRKDREPWDEEWREVQDRRYDKGFYPGSGKINPFFRRIGEPDRRFGFQLLILSAALIAPPLLGFIERQFLFPLGAIALIFAIGGISHLRNAAKPNGG